METYRILQVPKWTVSLFILASILWMAFIILATIGMSMIFEKSITGLPLLFTIAILIIGSGFIFYKICKKIIPKKEKEITISEDFISVDNESIFKWEDISWYRFDAGSAFVTRFVIGLKNKEKISLMIWNDSIQIGLICKIKDQVIKGIKLRNLSTKNYYDTKNWKKISYAALISNLIIPIILVAIGFELKEILYPIIIWFAISVSASISILILSEK
ncbi:MAG: hypothetical protein AB8B73_08120 [Ekhidna sp.]